MNRMPFEAEATSAGAGKTRVLMNARVSSAISEGSPAFVMAQVRGVTRSVKWCSCGVKED